jgi:hypothetical protein
VNRLPPRFVTEQKAKWSAENELAGEKKVVQARENRHKSIMRKHMR